MGCGEKTFLSVFENLEISFSTVLLIAIKPSQLLIKYLVNISSPGLFSCGRTLSVRARTLVFDFTSLAIVPRLGPKKGSQYLKRIKSGLFFFMKFATENQFRGL